MLEEIYAISGIMFRLEVISMVKFREYAIER